MRFFQPKLLDSLKGYNGALLSKDILADITGLAHQLYEMATRAGLLERLPIDYIYPDLQQGIARAIS